MEREKEWFIIERVRERKSEIEGDKEIKVRERRKENEGRQRKKKT